LREATDVDRTEFLLQALGVELDYRRRRGESPTPEEYLARFPEDAKVVGTAFEETTVSFHPASPADSARPGLPDTEPSLEPGSAAPPTQIGRFVVIRRLGAGGQGSAILARDPDLGRLVVLKRYHTSARDPNFLAAVQDGRALARLRSRYTPQCHGLERIGDEL